MEVGGEAVGPLLRRTAGRQSGGGETLRWAHGSGRPLGRLPGGLASLAIIDLQQTELPSAYRGLCCKQCPFPEANPA